METNEWMPIVGAEYKDVNGGGYMRRVLSIEGGKVRFTAWVKGYDRPIETRTIPITTFRNVSIPEPTGPVIDLLRDLVARDSNDLGKRAAKILEAM